MLPGKRRCSDVCPAAMTNLALRTRQNAARKRLTTAQYQFARTERQSTSAQEYSSKFLSHSEAWDRELLSASGVDPAI